MASRLSYGLEILEDISASQKTAIRGLMPSKLYLPVSLPVFPQLNLFYLSSPNPKWLSLIYKSCIFKCVASDTRERLILLESF